MFFIPQRAGKLLIFMISILFLVGCYRPVARYEPWQVPKSDSVEVIVPTKGIVNSPMPTTTLPRPETTPTPNAPKLLPTLRTESIEYIVQSGDTLARIALSHQVSVAQILAINEIENPNLIEVGQVFIIPPASTNAQATGFKIIPDTELVLGPSTIGFDIEEAAEQAGGYLATYSEVMDEGVFTGIQIVQRVANEYSVNPRVLLALLEYRSRWLSLSEPDSKTLEYPIGFADPYRKGLYNQLGWAANQLNRGFYLWQDNALAVWTLADGTVLRIDPTINAGTAGVQYFLSLLYDHVGWDLAVSENGLSSTYQRLFGYAFDYIFEPLIPDNLQQPNLILPFTPGDIWSYTSGPHGGWNDGSAWAALDFAPPGEALGCFPSVSYVTASADGVIVRSALGAVVQELDGDGHEQTGWTILYMHIGSEGRVDVGTYVKAGDVIGHPSCEGGFSSGTHLHIARRYNGVWISAIGDSPFEMDGWLSSGDGIEYDGYLVKNGQTLTAWNGRTSFNQISR